MTNPKSTNGSRRQPPKAAKAPRFSTASGGGKPQKLKQATLFETLHEIEKQEAAQKQTRPVKGGKVTGGRQEVKTTQKRESGAGAAQNPPNPPNQPKEKEKVATNLMKMVASKAFDPRKVKKTFSEQETKELRWIGQKDETKEDRIEVREEYRRIKYYVRELEAGNNSRLIVFPSLVTGEGWYKVVEFSALYYVYRLAERMGRIAHIMKDSDRYVRCCYTASIVNIERFIEQFERFEGSRPEITDDGVLIFTLKQPLTEDEVGALKRVEETRREKLHNLLKPKAMEPAMFQAILTVMRQVSPKVEKMHLNHYKTTGEQMMRDIEKLLAVYFDFSCGFYDRKTAGVELMKIVNRLMSALTLLSETRIWKYDAAAMVGENLNDIRRLAIKEFGLTLGREG